MTRKEVEKSREYHIHKAATEWYKSHNNDDVFDFFEAGYNKGYKDAVENPNGGALLHVLNKGAAIGRREILDKACEWLYKRQAEDLEVPNIEKFIDDLRKDMEE